MAEESVTQTPAATPITADDVLACLHERGWLDPTTSLDEPLRQWIEQAAAWLSRFAADRAKLAELLELVFRYDARAILASPESHAVLARQGAREVLRELAFELLTGPPVDSNRFRELVERVRQRTGWKGRELFHPLRLALAGRAGEGELDRVILLLDPAAALPFRVPVKGTRERILEFCSVLD
jgi:restriction endonuclease Mrr